MIGISVLLDAGDEIATHWATAPAIVQEEVVPAMLEATLLLEREIKERAPAGASNLLRNSIQARPLEIAPDGIAGKVSTTLDYAIPVELGTRPHRPPVAPILDWVEAKLGLTGEEAEEAAYKIASAIAKRGTKGRFMFERGYQENLPQLGGIFGLAALRIRDRLATPEQAQ